MAKVLIVEDEMLVADDIRFSLHEQGHSVVGIAVSGEQAVYIAQHSDIDVILMDIKLRGKLNGIETTALIWNTVGKQLPVIFMSAYDSAEFDTTLVLGAKEFTWLRKPVSTTTVGTKIRQILNN